MKITDAPIATEHEEQVALIEWWSLACGTYKLPEFLLFAIPNGGARHPAVGAKLKAEGVRKSAPDLFLSVARGGYHGLYIELKRHGEKLRAGQTDFFIMLMDQGYDTSFAQGADEAMAAISAYLKLPAGVN